MLSLYRQDEDPTVELMNDPNYREVFDAAVWTVWENITDEYER
jgi:hypothetical protein